MLFKRYESTEVDCKYIVLREKGRDLTKSYDKIPYTHRKIQKASWQHTKTPTKTSTTQPLRTDLGRSVGVTAVIFA